MTVLMHLSAVLGAWLFVAFPLALLIGASIALCETKSVEHDPAGVVPCSTNAGLGVSNPGASGSATTDHQLGPSLTAGSAGVRRDSRQAAGAMTSAVTVRLDGKAVGRVAHARTGGTNNR